ncbi:prepilin peptidase [Thermoactinomyces mirandus]|uniref:Prepilin peptidase n=1 Tax=Thermoactinomyces mirandus TaxID=2756294 RepID=A0A7W2APT2_9BACL|nr:A24 family peptidase [Thermoactinomyces mirandus]MBA4601279.1 prepilin peptidase [Thermoactinomyces mirandus]
MELEPILYLVLIGLLIAAAVTDIRERLIYDRFIVIGIAATVLVRFFERTEPWWNYLLTGVVSFLFLYVIAVVTNERSIGGGDVKLFGMLGLAVGFEPFLVIYFGSHMLAALYLVILKLVRWKKIGWHTEFPFAPFILLATLVCYLWKFPFGG